MKIAAVIALTLYASTAFADQLKDPPSYGKVINTQTHETSEYACKPVDQNTIDCEFDDLRLYPVAKEEDRQKTVDDAAKQFTSAADKSVYEPICSFINFYDTVQSGKGSLITELTKLMQKQPSEADFRGMNTYLAESSKSQGYKEYIDASRAFCQSKTVEGMKAMTSANFTLSTRTCSVWTFKRSARFSNISGTWVAQGQPMGECGEINLSRFIPNRSTSFQYYDFERRYTTANPDGIFISGDKTCKEAVDRTELFEMSPKSNGFFLPCDYIKY